MHGLDLDKVCEGLFEEHIVFDNSVADIFDNELFENTTSLF